MAPLIPNTYPECLYVYFIFSFFQRTLLTFKLFMELLGLATRTGGEEEKEESNTCTDSYRSHDQHLLRGDRCGWLLPASIFHTVKTGNKTERQQIQGLSPRSVCDTRGISLRSPWGIETMAWLVFLKPRWENHSQDCHIV